ncbi:MAG: penicillin-binding protein 2 [Alphaproteobacteria bacterium]|nr:penicillin-binding protein 2 [Alphaproteobacteria bacterium]
MNRDNDKGKILLSRTMLMAIVNFFLLFILIARLYYLQVVDALKYKTLADENRISTRILMPIRGTIFDRNGIVLADNEQNLSAMIVAEQAPSIDATIAEFKKYIDINDKEEQKIRKEIKNHRKFVPVKLKDNLSWEEVSSLQLNTSSMPGIIIDQGVNRFYPMGQYTAHFLGYVGSVDEKEKNDDPLLMVPGFKVGKSGLEKFFENKLRGISGNVKFEVNAYGRIMKEIERNNGQEGEALRLTVDANLQKYAQDTFGEHSGAAVVLDVHSGEILAFVSVPSFDPNLFTKGLSHEEWNKLLYNERNPLVNKAVTGRYSPGSTFKIAVALAALENNIVSKDKSFYCGGAMTLGNHKFHCWKHSGHGYQNVVEAIKNSCDIYFYEVAMLLGIEKIADMARILGLGNLTGVTLENEQKGIIPDKEWKLKRYGEKWQQGETIIAGIGQGYVQVTPLQLAIMTARVANGGYEIYPSFTKLSLKDKAKIKKLPISNKNIEIVKQGMFEVVNGERGTAASSSFNINGIKMSGKTGTTQVRRISLKERQNGIKKDEDLPWSLRSHALFVGFTPHDKPKYAVAVIVEHGSSGSGAAAPIASKILQKALELNI